ncbi:unnamed protein product, partial [Closterium sp. Naga37s-1]
MSTATPPRKRLPAAAAAAAARARQQQPSRAVPASPCAALPSPSPWLALDLLLEAFVTSKRVPAAPTTIAARSPASSSGGDGSGTGVLAPPLLVGCCWSDDSCRALPESIAGGWWREGRGVGIGSGWEWERSEGERECDTGVQWGGLRG